MAVSVDTPEQLRTHLAKTGWTFTFLSDPEARALRSYGLVHEAAEGQVIARPAELLIDPTGTIRWVDMTDDYKVRTRPETVLEVFDRLAG